MKIMRLLFFVTLFSAILFSEVASHVGIWEVDIAWEYEMPSVNLTKAKIARRAKKIRLKKINSLKT